MFDRQYNPADWYWVMPDGRVWSSAAVAWVDANDAGLHVFIETGGEPVLIQDDDEIRNRLAESGLGHLGPNYVPQTVKSWQFREALRQMQLLTAVTAMVSRMPDTAVKTAWEYADEITRDNRALEMLAAKLGLAPIQLDALFVMAAKIRVEMK
jgi:hypothetical protein